MKHTFRFPSIAVNIKLNLIPNEELKIPRRKFELKSGETIHYSYGWIKLSNYAKQPSTIIHMNRPIYWHSVAKYCEKWKNSVPPLLTFHHIVKIYWQLSINQRFRKFQFHTGYQYRTTSSFAVVTHYSHFNRIVMTEY